MTRDPARLSGPDRERRNSDADRREPIDQDAPRDAVSDGVAIEIRCRQLTTSLREALGPDGCSALLARALGRCEAQHPVLRHLRGPDDRELELEGVSTAVAQYGVGVVKAAVDALVASLVEILGRLIGEDMALRLIDVEGRDLGKTGRTRE